MASALPLALLSAVTFAQVQVIVKYPQENLSPGDYISIRGAGYGLSWSNGKRAASVGDNTWSLTLPNSTGPLQLKALVNDNIWQQGANAVIVPSSPTFNFTVYPWFGSQAGHYTTPPALQNLYSTYFDNTRDIVIYTPPSYYENTMKTYPVLVGHDGQNLFNASTSFQGIAWDIDQTVNALIAQERISEMVIIGVYNTAKRIAEYTYSTDPEFPSPQSGEGQHYLDWLEQHALPKVVADGWRIDARPGQLRMFGSSLGGLLSCYACYTRPTIWAQCVCMSSSFWWNDEDFHRVIQHQPPPPSSSIFYVDSGNTGPDNDDFNQTLTVRKRFQELGWRLGDNLGYYVMDGGSHNEASWGARFYVPMLFLFGVED
eukprot:m.40188 g.40188  ORF g.40188 m.40188 type:complete len:372 (+) comp12731_c1_seq1:847-1962(+)